MAASATMRTLRPLCNVLLLLLSLLAFHVRADDQGDQQDQVDLHSRGLILVKVYALLIFLVSTFAGGVSPYFFRWNESFLLLGTQYAAGIFFGTALLHFLGDSTTTFQEVTTNPYPFSFMLACSGYLITMAGDLVIQMVIKRSAKESKVDAEGGRLAGHQELNSKESGLDLQPAFVKTSSLGDTILLILALCFHSVFEGIAVGVSGTKADAWRNLWTISLHKVFAAISMGIALLKMLPKRPFLITAIYSFLFAISSPIGVGIGIAIDATTQGATANWIYAISMGIAAGVFVYVAINHLIAKGFKPQEPNYFDTPFFKYLALLGGVATMAVVMIWD